MNTLRDATRSILRTEPAHGDDLRTDVAALAHDLAATFQLLAHSVRQWETAAASTTSAAEATHSTGHVLACLRQSQRLVDDLSLLTKTGISNLEPARVDLNAVIGEILGELQSVLSERRVAVLVEAHLPAVWCHELRVKQALGNLLQNALRHGCHPQAPRIEITLDPATTDENRIGLRIFDNGPGLATNPIKAPHRVDAASTVGAAATPRQGLGLAIVRRLVEHYGGRLQIDAPPGGSVRLSFPAAPPQNV